MNESSASDALRARIADLESQVQICKTQLRMLEEHEQQLNSCQQAPSSGARTLSLRLGPSLHNLLLLSDTALPLGSFAYSSGLESFLAHYKPLPPGTTQISLFHKFLRLSIQSIAFTNMPYVLASFRNPAALTDLDNDLDASTLCTVARSASVAQGRALLGVWEKSFAASAQDQFPDSAEPPMAIENFIHDLKHASGTESVRLNAHLAPLWGVVCLALGLNLEEAGYLFLMNQAKAVLSAAVRASVMGPYLAQSILAGRELQTLVKTCLEKVWFVQPEDAGQTVPMIDLWIGRHELLYTKIFNS